MDMCYNMKMILNSIYSVEMTFFILHNSPNIFEQIISLLFLKDGLSILCTENNLINQLRIRAHNSSLFLSCFSATLSGLSKSHHSYLIHGFASLTHGYSLCIPSGCWIYNINVST